jgi:predicted nucleotidyltransferase
MDTTKQNKISTILHNQINIKFACLFGSVVKNKTRYGSDIDIAIYFESEPDIIEIGDLVVKLEQATANKIDIVKLNNLDKENPRLAYSILSNCNLIYSGNEDLFKKFRASVLLQYLDFKFITDKFDNDFNRRLSSNNFAVFDK